MAKVTVADLAGVLEQLRAQMAELSKRMEVLESGKAAATNRPAATPAEPAAAPVAAAAPPQPAPVEISDEELLAVSAAIAAFLGVKARIRQIRLVSSTAWAQQGRVSIQASHRLQG